MAEGNNVEIGQTSDKQEFKQLQRDGFVVRSERYGNIAVGIRNISGLPGGIEDVIDENGRVYLNFNPENNAFAVWSSKPIEDKFSSGAIDENNPNLWVSPASNTGIKPDLGLILDQMTDGQFEPTGQLKEYFDDLKAVKEIGNIVEESLTAKEPEPPISVPNLSPEGKSDKIEGMTPENEHNIAKNQPGNTEGRETGKKLSYSEQIEELLDRKDKTLIVGNTRLVRIAQLAIMPANRDDIQALKGLLVRGNDINASDETIPLEEWQFLSSTIIGRIKELEEAQEQEKKKAEPEAEQKKEEPGVENKESELVKAIREQTEEAKREREAREIYEAEQRKVKEEAKAAEDKKQDGERKKKEKEEQEKIKQQKEEDNLPENEKRKRQLSMVRAILNKIESAKTDSHNVSIAAEVKNLRGMEYQLHPEVMKEVKVRLALNESAALIMQASGFIEKIVSAASTAEGRGLHLTREVVLTLLQEGLPGLRIAHAWDLLQSANYNYEQIVKDANLEFNKNFGLKGVILRDQEVGAGQVPINFYTDENEERRGVVRGLMVQRIVETMKKEKTQEELDLTLNGSEEEMLENAHKSLELAEELAMASLENSVFNRTANTGNDELAEIIGLKGWRYGKKKNGDIRGPEIHMGLIDGFGTSWIRWTMASANNGENGTNKPFLTPQIDMDEVRTNWTYYCTVVINKWQSARTILLDRNPDPGKTTTPENISNLVKKVFDAADPNDLTPEEQKVADELIKQAILKGKETEEKVQAEINNYKKEKKGGPRNLRAIWLLGILNVTLANRTSGWGGREYGRLERLLTDTPLGDSGTFLTKEQYKWAESEAGKKYGGFDLALIKKTAASPEVIESFIKGALGVKGK